MHIFRMLVQNMCLRLLLNNETLFSARVLKNWFKMMGTAAEVNGIAWSNFFNSASLVLAPGRTGNGPANQRILQMQIFKILLGPLPTRREIC
jgi:hypothetical protein